MNVYLWIIARVMSYAHVLSRSIWLLACPVVLSYDWQMGSIPLVTRLNDHRNVFSAALLTSICARLFYVVRRLTISVCNEHLLLLLLLLLPTCDIELNAMQLADWWSRRSFTISRRLRAVIKRKSIDAFTPSKIGAVHVYTTYKLTAIILGDIERRSYDIYRPIGEHASLSSVNFSETVRPARIY